MTKKNTRTQAGVRISPTIIRTIKKAFDRWTKVNPSLEHPNRVWEMLLQRGLAHSDPATGAETVPPAGASCSLSLPPFFDGLDRLPDAALIPALNRIHEMAWASNPAHECVHVTPALEAYSGWSKVQFLALDWLHSIHPEDQAGELNTAVAAYAAKAPFCNRYRMRRPDGKFGWVYEEAHPRFDADGAFAGYLGVISHLYDAEVEAAKDVDAVFRIASGDGKGFGTLVLTQLKHHGRGFNVS